MLRHIFYLLVLSSFAVQATDYGRAEWEVKFLNDVINSDIKPYYIEIEYSISDDCDLVLHKFHESSDGSIVNEDLEKKIIAKYIGPHAIEKDTFALGASGDGVLGQKPIRKNEKSLTIKWLSKKGHRYIECFFSGEGEFTHAENIRNNISSTSGSGRNKIDVSLSKLGRKRWRLDLKK